MRIRGEEEKGGEMIRGAWEERGRRERHLKRGKAKERGSALRPLHPWAWTEFCTPNFAPRGLG